MNALLNWFANRMLDLAAAIVPDGRREWVEAMRAEFETLGSEQLTWALGCLQTALAMNLRAVTPGRAGGFISGLVVVALGLMFMAGAVRSNALATDMGRGQAERLAAYLPVALTSLFLLFGGITVLLAPIVPVLGAAGRWLFGLGSLLFAFAQADIAFGHMRPDWFHLNDAVAAMAFTGAGVALISSRSRIYWPSVVIALAVGLSETARVFPAVRIHTAPADLALVMAVCFPALLLLASGALILKRPLSPTKS